MLGSFWTSKALQKLVLSFREGLSQHTQWEPTCAKSVPSLDIFIWALTAYPRAIEWLPFQWIVVDIGKKKPPPINSSVLDFWMSFLHGGKWMEREETHKKHEISIESVAMMARGGSLIGNQHVICSRKQLPPLTKNQIGRKSPPTKNPHDWKSPNEKSSNKKSPMKRNPLTKIPPWWKILQRKILHNKKSPIMKNWPFFCVTNLNPKVVHFSIIFDFTLWGIFRWGFFRPTPQNRKSTWARTFAI